MSKNKTTEEALKEALEALRRLSAAAKRASLDLTRKLADLRAGR